MKRIMAFLVLMLFSLISLFAQPRREIPETILPLALMEAIINEASGDLALQNEIFLTAVNRNRLPEEYLKGYFETNFILEKLREYGIGEASVLEFASDLFARSILTWDAEMAELWMVEPEKKKLADLKEVPAVLCSGSASVEVTAELVYVGPGTGTKFYEGKDLKGKIVLVNGYPEGARRLAVEQHGAAGMVAFSSSHPEFDPDQVGWSSIRASEKEKQTFAFMVSTHQGQDLRNMLERGAKVVLRAVCKTQMVPYKNEMVSALIRGSEFPEEELVFTAHLFEGFAKQGANDDASGCAAILETARVLKRLLDSGTIPPLKRSVRFLFIPEISGTAAFISQYPELAGRFFANINEDMVGEALIKNHSYFSLKRTPWSIPSYLNDVLEAVIEWVGVVNRDRIETRGRVLPIVSPTGSQDPFYYAIDDHYGASDHIVFIDGGVKVPAVMLIAWPDQWYHTSGDLPDKSDSTQLKRVVVISAASAVFLAKAGKEEAERMILETSGRGLSRLSKDKLKSEYMLFKANTENIHRAYQEARNYLDQAFLRERETLASVALFIKGDGELGDLQAIKDKELESLRLKHLQEIDGLYRFRCLREKVKAEKLRLAPEEVRLSRLVPVRTEAMKGFFNSWLFREKLAEQKDLPKYQLGRAEFEVRNFIDGKRSILEIRNAASAELGPVSLKDVENYLLVLEKTGFVKIRSK